MSAFPSQIYRIENRECWHTHEYWPLPAEQWSNTIGYYDEIYTIIIGMPGISYDIFIYCHAPAPQFMEVVGGSMPLYICDTLFCIVLNGEQTGYFTSLKYIPTPSLTHPFWISISMFGAMKYPNQVPNMVFFQYIFN